jgi:hypothetical protein
MYFSFIRQRCLFLSLFLPFAGVVVVVETNIPDAPAFSTNLGVDAYYVQKM